MEGSQAPRLLATLREHLQAVTAARFSHDGKYLASGSDDTLACLYELHAGPGVAAFGSSEQPNLENWKHTRTFRGHTANITDLAWSPNHPLLATCSLDNQILIWEATSGRQLKALTQHHSTVKGLAWDPVGYFMASQADDKSLILWRTDDWVPVTTITAPFVAAVPSTFCLRFGWTPDGQILVAVNCNEPRICAPLLNRGTWEPKHQLMGHKAPIVTGRSSTKLFHPPSPAPQGTQHACIAVGSQDTRISVWSTMKETAPIAVLSDIFQQSVLDIAWTPDGYTMVACSTDGSIVVVRFDETELGTALTAADMEAHMSSFYGDRKQPGYLPPDNDVWLDSGAADVDNAQHDHAPNGLVSNRLIAFSPGPCCSRF